MWKQFPGKCWSVGVDINVLSSDDYEFKAESFYTLAYNNDIPVSASV